MANSSVAELRVAAICEGSYVHRTDGLRLREAIESAWQEGAQAQLDFENIRIASVSFFDEAIGVLALRLPLADIRTRVAVRNLSAPDRQLLNRILTSRAAERAAASEADDEDLT